MAAFKKEAVELVKENSIQNGTDENINKVVKDEVEEEEEEDVQPCDTNSMPGGRNFNCPICDAPFNRKFNRDQHISSHTKDVPCRICSLSFRSENALQTHLIAAHSPKQIKGYIKCHSPTVHCPKCSAKFSSYYQLYFHDQSQHASSTGARLVKCEDCDKFFANEKLLQSHAAKKHRQQDKNRTCSICDKDFATKQTLAHHMRIHTGSKPVECPDCDQTFRCESLYRQHRVSHHTDNTFQCALCGQSFSRSNYLRKHLKNHFG